MFSFPTKVLFHAGDFGPLAIKRLFGIFKIAGDHEDGDRRLHAGSCMQIWTAILLKRTMRPEDHGDWLYCLLERCSGDLANAGNELGRPLEPDKRVKQYQLLFADGRFATWTGAAGFIDLENDKPVEALPYPAIQSISYNLTELFRRNTLRCESLQNTLLGVTDASQPLTPVPSPGSLDG